MTPSRWLLLFAAALVGGSACSFKRKPASVVSGPRDVAEGMAAGAAVPTPGGVGGSPGGGARPGSPGGYPVSGDLRNPPVSVPRVSGNSQVSISRADVAAPYLAMTFDDGPHPSNTPRLLDLLAQRNIKATFYVVGTNARRHPNLLRRMIAEGHEIGNHTVNHVGLSRISNEKIRAELAGAHQAVVEACGVPPTTVRPPYGAVTAAQKQWIFEEFGYTTVMWSVDPRDWQRPGVSVVARRLVEGARNGSILLAHDIHPPTVEAMPSALDELLRRGFRFVTVSELMALQGTAAVGPPLISEAGHPAEVGPPSELMPVAAAAAGLRVGEAEGLARADAASPAPLDAPVASP